jgi:hypothetical protein
MENIIEPLEINLLPEIFLIKSDIKGTKSFKDHITKKISKNDYY